MAKLTRATLKTLFGAGSSPTEDHFGDLIESSANILDDAGINDTNKLVSIHSSEENDHQVIQLHHGEKTAKHSPTDWDISLLKPLEFDIATLLFRAGNKQQFDPQNEQNKGPGVLALTSHDNANKVGINNNLPQYELDVNGVVKSSGRIGELPELSAELLDKVRADGQWHSICGAGNVSQGFEVMAKIEGQHNPMVHGVALFVPSDPEARSGIGWFGKKSANQDNQTHQKGINLTHTAKGKKSPLQLRWQVEKDRVDLQISSVKPLAEAPLITCYVTRLWFDEHSTIDAELQTQAPENPSAQTEPTDSGEQT